METCGCILKQLKEASTDIIIVSNEFLFKNDIVSEIDKNLTRGCNVVDVTNLELMSIIQRMVYGLLEKDSFSIRDADHIVFTLLSEYSRGAATIVHMLTSLMKKCDDNRTGFQLAKHQLKLHIGHKKYHDALRSSKQRMEDNQSKYGGVISTVEGVETALATSEHSDDPSTCVQMSSTEVESTQHSSTFEDVKSISRNSSDGGDNVKVSNDQRKAECSTSSDDFMCPEAYHESMERHTGQTTADELLEMNNTPYGDTDTTPLVNKPFDYTQKSEKSPGIISSAVKKVISYVIGSDDKQKPTGDMIKTDEDDLPSAKQEVLCLPEKKVHSPIYLYINGILRSDDFSLPAQHLLHCLSIVGSIPLPKFYVDELDKLITEAMTTREDRRIQRVRGFIPEPLVDQLEKGGVVRTYPNPVVYHKDFNPKNVDPTIKLMFIPKLICDAIDSEMDATDKAVSITCVQHAIENILTGKSILSMIHLHYLLVLCNRLFDVCVSEQSTLGDAFVVESLKLKFRVVEHTQTGIT